MFNLCRMVLRQSLNLPGVLANVQKQPPPTLLKPQSICSIQWPIVAGLKHVATPRRRCSHCYMVYEDERVWVLCDKYPRHKQVTRKTRRQAKNEMIMTHATNGGTRGKHGRGRMHMWTQDGMRLDF